MNTYRISGSTDYFNFSYISDSNDLLLCIENVVYKKYLGISIERLNDSSGEKMYMFTIRLKDIPKDILYTSNLTDQPEVFLYTMKFLLQKYCSRYSRILIHGSAVLGKDGAHVFIGPSGAGKSTIAHNSNLPIIAEDTCAIFIQDNAVWIECMRFDLKPIDISLKEGEYIKVRGIYVIKQAQDYRVDVISPANSVQYIANNCIAYQVQKLEYEVVNESVNSIECVVESPLSSSVYANTILSISSLIPVQLLFFYKNYIFSEEKKSASKLG